MVLVSSASACSASAFSTRGTVATVQKQLGWENTVGPLRGSALHQAVAACCACVLLMAAGVEKRAEE